MLEYEGARIQLLDLPGIVQDAAKGRGRGRQVVSVAKTADLILITSERNSIGAWLTDSRRDKVGGAEGAARARARGCRNPSEYRAA